MSKGSQRQWPRRPSTFRHRWKRRRWLNASWPPRRRTQSSRTSTCGRLPKPRTCGGARLDRQEAGQYAITGFARDLLTVADNLQRALASVDADARAADPALAALTEGVEMTEKELLTVMERHGVKPIAAQGRPFDPHVHEALYEVPNPDVPHGTVVQVAQTGYLLHDRTLRPARVGIARGGPKPGTPQATRPEDASDDGILHFRKADADPTGADPYRRTAGPGSSRIDESH